MIKRFSAYYLLAALLMMACLQARAQSGGQVITVKKGVSQRFPATKNVMLVLNNYFGNVKVATWKRSTILVKAMISANAENAAKAAGMLKRIHIDFSNRADSIVCTAMVKSDATISIIGMDPKHSGQASKTVDTAKPHPISIMILPAKWCTVNFEVYLPATQPLSIDDHFGNITIGDYAGRLNISQSFGDFTAGNLTGPTRFDLSQGNVSIRHLNLGQIKVKTFDHVNIGGISGALNSQFKFGRLLNLNVKSLRYADSIGLKAGNVQQVNISGVIPITTRYLLKLAFSKLQFDGADFTPGKNTLSFREINIDKSKKEAQRLDDSILQAHPELKIIPKDAKISGELRADTIASKKKKELTILALAKFKKVHEYAAGPENAKTQVNIDIDFGTLNLTK